MDIPRLESMKAHWEYQPPLHISVARYLGINPKTEKRVNKDEDIAALLAQIPRTPK